MYGTSNANELKQRFEGNGWENSISVNNLSELQAQLQNLGTIISANDDTYGFSRSHSGLRSRLVDSENPIDSYSSFQQSSVNNLNEFWGWGNYHYNPIDGYDGVPLDYGVSFDSWPGVLNSIASYRDNDLNNTYLTFDLDYGNAQLSNGFDLYTYGSVSGDDYNPELVLTLNQSFWDDVDSEISRYEDQKALADSLTFEILDAPVSIDLSSIKSADDPTEALANIIDDLRVTVQTDRRWDLPLYSQNLYANLNLRSIEESDNGNFWRHISLNLADHDSSFGESRHSNDRSGAVELTENGEGTVFEFGVSDGWQLSELLQNSQEAFNFTQSSSLYEVDSINFNFDQLLDGSNFNLHINTQNVEESNRLVGADDFSIEVSPYNNYISNFSEENFPQIQTLGDFSNVIDVWATGDEGPQLYTEDGLSKFRNSNFNLEFESTDGQGYLNIHSHYDSGLFGQLEVNTDFGEYLPNISNFKLQSINFNGNGWNIRTNPDDSYENTHVNVQYSVDDNGAITAINNGSSDTYIPTIYELIPNVDSLINLDLAGQNDLSYAEQLQATIELGFDGSSFAWNNDIILPPPPPEEAALLAKYSFEDLDQLAILGDSVDAGAKYNLAITAEMLNNFNLEGADITIEFENKHFNDLTHSDITIGSALPVANAVEVNNDAGTIRIAASSLSQLNSGDGVGDTEAVLANISFDFDEAALAGISKNSDGSLVTNPLSFKIAANIDETVLSRQWNDGSGYENKEISTLRELNQGIIVEGKDVTLYEAKINFEQLDDGLVIGTDRVIGADASFTNLVRKGDLLTTTSEWLNVGNIEANDLSYSAMYNQNASLESADFSQTSVASGSFINGVFVKDNRESTTLTTDIRITGDAGNVVDLSDGIVSIQADGSEVFTNQGKGSSNLITFQGDLNYDGRVSMKDLAYLNAGAARQQEAVNDPLGDADNNGILDASVARDVDADFNGKIDLADLSILDADWGKTLHTGDRQFQGSSDVSWSQLDDQGIHSSWDNDSFKDQNETEAEANYVGSLESPTATNVIGADGNTDANDADSTGTYFQEII